MKPKNTICLCARCISAIRSRGEKVVEWDRVDDDIFYEFDSETDDISTLPYCEWCEEKPYIDEEGKLIYDDELKICVFP